MAMDQFTRYASFTVARDASFAAVAAVTLMVAFSFDPPLALEIAAHVALGFALVLLVRAFLLTESRVIQSEPWRGLEPELRPSGERAAVWARDCMEGILLRFAKTSSGIACGLIGAALIVSAM